MRSWVVHPGWFSVFPQCPRCGLAYSREPGDSVGAIILIYGVTALIVIAAHLLVWLAPDVWGAPHQTKILAWLAFTVATPLARVRLSRSIWLPLDY